MIAVPTAAIDPPLKILIWEDPDGKVWLSYNEPVYLANRHEIPAELLQNITAAKSLAAAASQ
jgi:uncharacterized protein (DUF302 family)